MKKNCTAFLYLLLLLFIFHYNGMSQTHGFTTNNPFKTDVFIKNSGQFDNLAETSSPIKYVVNNADKAFFTKEGITFKLEKTEKITEEEHEEIERNGDKEGKLKVEIFYVNINWEGCNAASIETSEETEGYYTFGEKGFENIKAKGYKKITYKNLYPYIDAEYTIPAKGGIKYKLIIHPGADINAVKLRYSGNVDELKLDKEGNVVIKTPAGNITDHAPLSYIESTNEKISSAFEIKNNTVFFKLQTTNKKAETIIIDPWTTTPTSLSTNNAAYDIDYDDNGNIYVSGGNSPYKLTKYSSSGVFIWTFTNPATWSNGGLTPLYSKFCVLPQSGNILIGEGSGPGGPRVMKISTSGILLITSTNFFGTSEIWVMFYNRCSHQLIGFGGDPTSSNNLVAISDTNLTGWTSSNYNTSINTNNDIGSAKMDFNGDFYALNLTWQNGFGSPAVSYIQKSLFSSGYAPPPFWNVNSNYNFNENNNNGIPGFVGWVTNRANALALNNSYLYSYDGLTLKAWNKTSGVLIDSIVVNAAYTGGEDRVHEGIAVNECNNVYVGGTGMVHVFYFNGTNFSVTSTITNNIPAEVYDVRLDGISGNLYVSGNSFVTLAQVANCGASSLIVHDSISTANCTGYASVTVTGGTPPYTYQWNNGATTNSISGIAAGTYNVIISDNSCIINTARDTVHILNTNYNVPVSAVICNGSTYTFPDGITSTTATTDSSHFTALGGCDSVIITTLSVHPTYNQNVAVTICSGSTYTFPDGTTSTVAATNTTNLTSVAGCDSIINTTLTISPNAVVYINIAAAVCNGSTYTFPDGTTSTTATTNISNLNSSGACDSIITTVLSVNPTYSLAVSVSICNGNTYTFPDGTTSTISAIHTSHFNTYLACDSSIVTTLTVKPTYNNTVSVAICSGNTSYNFPDGTSSTLTTTHISNLTTVGGCDSIITTNLTVNPLPVLTFTHPADICIDALPFALNYATPAGGTYSGAGVTNNNFNPQLATAGTHLISYNYQNPITNCTNTITENITVHPLPIVEYSINPKITSILNPEITFNDLSPTDISRIWNLGDGYSSPLKSFTHTYNDTGYYSISIIITDNFGCKNHAEDMVYISPDFAFYIPNAFSPNADGINDEFFGKGYGISEYHLDIWDRWGERIFHSDDINNHWKGTYNNGSEVQQDVYTYKIEVIEINGKSHDYLGKVTLIR